MSIPEAIALWIKARADRLAHRHEWKEERKMAVQRSSGAYAGDMYLLSCKCGEIRTINFVT